LAIAWAMVLGGSFFDIANRHSAANLAAELYTPFPNSGPTSVSAA